MKKFKISVNGTSYDVEVEEIKDGVVVSAPTPKAAPAAVASPAAPKAAPAPAAPKAAAAIPEGSYTVNAPMPGTILSIKVAPGDVVKRGTVLLILEAMKMENEIQADRDGTVASIAVSQGDSVSTNQVLLALA